MDDRCADMQVGRWADGQMCRWCAIVVGLGGDEPSELDELGELDDWRECGSMGSMGSMEELEHNR